MKAIKTAIAMISGAYKTSLVSYFTHRDLFPSLMKVCYLGLVQGATYLFVEMKTDLSSSSYKILRLLFKDLSLFSFWGCWQITTNSSFRTPTSSDSMTLSMSQAFAKLSAELVCLAVP